MIIEKYDRKSAVQYAKAWALKRNNKYYNFDNLGGDCTNFVSQCIHNACKIMNNENNGWYYYSLNNRSPSWSGVEFLYRFITTNNGVGPFGKLVNINEIDIGDIIELGNNEDNYYHTIIVSKITDNNIYVCSHTIDSLDRPLNSYVFYNVRYIKIDGIRK